MQRLGLPRIRLGAPLLAAATSFAACSSGPSEPIAGSVGGLVTVNGVPAPDVVVTASFTSPNRPPETTVTAADGSYAFPLSHSGGSIRVTVSVAPPPDFACDPADEEVTLTTASPDERADFACVRLEPAQVLIPRPAVSILAGRTGEADFTATVLSGSGRELSTAQLVWEVLDPSPGVTSEGEGRFVVSDQTPGGDYHVRASAGSVAATAVIQVVEIVGDLYYSAAVGLVRQVFFDRLDDPALPRQLWVNPEGNILHLAVNQENGTVYFAYGIAGGAEIMEMTPDGVDLFRFTTNPGLLNQTPAVDSGSGRIYFSRLLAGSQDIFRANANGTGLLRVTTPGGGGKLWPAVSPDGSQIAWSQDLGEGNSEIFTSTVAGADVRRYTAFFDSDIAPYWVSNERLAWTREITEDNAEVLAADWPSGANQETITRNESGLSYPGNESEPGRGCLPGTVLVRSDHQGKAEVFVIDDGSGASGLRAWLRVASADTDIASAAMRCR